MDKDTVIAVCSLLSLVVSIIALVVAKGWRTFGIFNLVTLCDSPDDFQVLI
jgi:hypothetical protein